MISRGRVFRHVLNVRNYVDAALENYEDSQIMIDTKQEKAGKLTQSQSPSTYKQITTRITACTTETEILQTCRSFAQFFNAIHIAALFKQLTTIDSTKSKALKKILSYKLQKLQFKPREISQIIWSLGKLKYDGTLDEVRDIQSDKKIAGRWKTNFEYLVQSAQSQLDEFDLEDFGMLLYGLASLGVKDEHHISNILEQVRDHLYIFSETKQNRYTTISPASVVSILWACGKLNVSQIDEILNLVLVLMQRKMVQFGSSELTIIAVSCSRARRNHQQLLNIVGKEAVQKLHMFQPLEIASINYAYSKLGVFNYDLFNKSAEILIRKNTQNFSVSQISQIAYAFQKIKFKRPDLAEKIKNSFSHRLSEFSNVEISNLLQFFSYNNLKDSNLLEKLRELYLLRIDSVEVGLQLQIFQNLLRLGLNDQETIQKTVSVVKEQISTLKNDDIRRFIQILSQINFYEEPLFDNLIKLVQQIKLNNFELYQIINIQQCLGAAGHFDENFTQLCLSYFSNNFDQFDSTNIQNICQIMSKFRVQNESLENLISARIINQDLDLFSAGQLTNIIWSFYVLNHQNENFFQILSEKLSTFQVHEFTYKNLNLLFLIHLFCQQNNIQDFLWEKLDQEVIMRAESSWKNSQSQRANQNSIFVEQIWDEIKDCVPKKFKFQFQKQIEDGSFVADICLESQLHNQKMVIMFTGPNSFARNNQNIAVGFQHINDNIMQQLGWNVINVKYGEQNKAEFIKQLLINFNVIQIQ